MESPIISLNLKWISKKRAIASSSQGDRLPLAILFHWTCRQSKSTGNGLNLHNGLWILPMPPTEHGTCLPSTINYMKMSECGLRRALSVIRRFKGPSQKVPAQINFALNITLHDFVPLLSKHGKKTGRIFSSSVCVVSLIFHPWKQIAHRS